VPGHGNKETLAFGCTQFGVLQVYDVLPVKKDLQHHLPLQVILLKLHEAQHQWPLLHLRKSLTHTLVTVQEIPAFITHDNISQEVWTVIYHDDELNIDLQAITSLSLH
jgi:hypothetical protein